MTFAQWVCLGMFVIWVFRLGYHWNRIDMAVAAGWIIFGYLVVLALTAVGALYGSVI